MVNKTYQLAVRYTVIGQFCENVLHFNKIDAGDPTDAQWLTIANTFKEAIRVAMTNASTFETWVATQVAGAGVTYSATTCKQVGGTLQSGLLTGTLIGAIAGDALPPLNTVSVQLRTGQRGRSYRSRLQLGAFTEAQQAGGVWGAAHVTALQTNLDGFRAVYGSGGSDTAFRWCTFSRGIASGCFPDPEQRHSPLVHRQEGNPDASIANITALVVNSVVSTTRSRLLD